ncbi:MAG: PKD domain-containing protein [Ignavibacteria bacterium]|nr:PKD domain-containing protein [Ignavibacteria bacterium]
MNKNILLVCIFLIVQSSQSAAQCMQYPVPLAERTLKAEVIIEGKILSHRSFSAGSQGMIYTEYTAEITKIFKGLAPSQKFVTFTTEGGVVGREAVRVSPEVKFDHGHTGIFFLQSHTKNGDFTGYEPYSWGQCIIRYDDNGGARDIFKSYTHIPALYSAITRLLGSTYRQIQPLILPNSTPKYNPKAKGEKTLAAAINNFNPTVITAGTYSVLTVNGSGFGNSYTGAAKMDFRNADDGGASFTSAIASQIVSWTDNQIQVRVPESAGTGVIRVTGVDGTQATSGATLTVDFAVFNLTDGNNAVQQTYLPNTNGNGGYTITFNTNFNTNTDAVAAFKRALKSWRCGTFVNYGVATGTSAINCNNGNDGVNIVTFDDNCTLMNGALGVTYSYWSSCATGYWRLREMDYVFITTAPAGGWNFGPGATNGNRYDFQSVALHEIGHGHQLGHIISTGKVMHYALGANSDVRTLNAVSDIGGGNDVVARSITTKPCGPGVMTKLTAGTCDVGIQPSAAFTGAPLQGCVPLTVNFTDQSTDAPTLWDWDFKNDGTALSTSQNPSYTYTTPGTYSVKLTASNASGTNSLTRTNYINVYALPTVDAGTNKTLCYGTTAQLGGAPTATGTLPPYTYLWSPSTGLDNPALPNPTVTATSLVPVVYTVTVTDNRSCVNQKSITVSTYPRPTANAGIDKSICFGGNTAIGGLPTASNGTPPFTYSWTPTTALSDATIANPTASPTVNTSYIVSVTDANNCIIRDTVSIAIYSKATVSAGIDKSVCIGQGTTIGGAPTATGGTPPYTYLWSPATGLNSTSSANPTATPATTTDYLVTVTDANSCQTLDTMRVTVHPLPTPIINVIRSTIFCAGDSATLDAGSYKKYLWSTGDSTRLIHPKIAGNYTVKVTNTNDCEQTSPPVTVIVNPRPNPVITPQKPTTFCEGENTVLDAGTGFKSYEWSNGATTQVITAQQAGNYTVTVTNISDCRGTSAPVAVVINPKPPVTITGPNSLCNNSTATYSVPDTPPSTFQWNVAGGTITGGNSTNSVTVQWGTTSGNVSLSRTTSATNCVNSSTYTVTISSTLSPIITQTGGVDCEGDSVILSAPAGYKNYVWSSGETTESIIVRSNGSYTVTVTDANNCTGSSTPKNVTFNPRPPKPTITKRVDTLFSTPAQGYQWSKNSTIIPNAINQFLVSTGAGKYAVKINDDRTCTSISDEFTVESNSVEEFTSEMDIHIYPNPTDGILRIELPQNEGLARCKVKNLLGMEVIDSELRCGSTAELSLSQFPAGMYVVEISLGNIRMIRTVVKE